MSNTKVNDNSEINDVRMPTDFRGTTFSNFKKTEVRTQFIESMKKGKVEPACYWCAELVCSGHFSDIWEILLHFIGKHIHLANPKLVIYLERRFTIFRNIFSQGHFLSELQLRNHNNVRKLFAEIVCIFTLSNKKHSFEPIKINKVEEFDMTQLTERLKAPSIHYIDPIIKPKDPKELSIAINEFAYNISTERSNMASACYWIEWVIEFDLICRKRKEQCHCVKRSQYPVDHKLQTDIIWLIWDTLLYYCELLQNTYITSILKSILSLFCIKYTSASPKKRRYLLYYAVAVLTEPLPNTIELIEDKTVLYTVFEQIDSVYKQIKKNEISPNTEYLFSNLEKQNTFEKSVQKIEIMNQMMQGGGAT
jgi:hypothetical protein